MTHPTVKKSIEKLLNDASGGEHSEVVMLLNERIMARVDEEKKKMAMPVAAQDSVRSGNDLPRLGERITEAAPLTSADALAQLRALSADGIDVGFLDSLPADVLQPIIAPSMKKGMPPDELLSLNSEVLHQLYLEQTKRLATGSTAHLGNIPTPSETEYALGISSSISKI